MPKSRIALSLIGLCSVVALPVAAQQVEVRRGERTTAPAQQERRFIDEARAAELSAERRRQLRRTPIVEAVERVRDSVVNISATRIVRTSPLGGHFHLAPEFESFFGPQQRKVQSAGSGFILHPSGYIVTNAHVVSGVQEPKVNMAGGKTYDAVMVAVDDEHDLAVLKVEPAEPLQAATLGTSSDLMIGETVIAIGNPFGFKHTVTSGVVSATERTLRFPDTGSPDGYKTYNELIQTDAAINPGNSGGPLLNILGEVIGINTAIRGDAQNIGFAIGVDQLRKFLPSILDVERINRVELGLHFDGVGQATVERIDEGSPAARAGLRVGDRIVAVDGEPVADDIDFFVRMVDKQAGQDVVMTVVRARERREFTVHLDARPDGGQQAWRKLGMRVREPSPDLAARLGISSDVGLLIYELHEAGPAHKAGIEPGDVLVRIGRTAATDLRSVAEALDDVKTGERVVVGIQRIQRRGGFARIQTFTVPLQAR